MAEIPKMFSQKHLKLNAYGTVNDVLNSDDVVKTNNKLIVLTAFGLVSGTYCSPKDFENGEKPKEIYDFISVSYKKLLEECYEHNPDAQTNFSRSIILKDANIRTSTNAKFNMPFIELFDDQIIGVTLGNLDK